MKKKNGPGRPVQYIRMKRVVLERWLGVVKAKLVEKTLAADDNVDISEEWAVVEEIEQMLKGEVK